MALRSHRSILPALAILLATSACASHALPSTGVAANSAPQASSVHAGAGHRTDTTSILQLLKKDVTIGSTVDAQNGDKGPRALSIAPCNCSGNLTQGQLVVCNFENSAGVAGQGTTIEALDPTPGSTPARFVQSRSIEGCDGAALSSINEVYGGGLTSGKLVEYSNTGKMEKTYTGSPVATPLWDADALPSQAFSPEYMYVGTSSGGIVSIGINFYGNGQALQVVKGFGVSTGSQGDLGPSGLQYEQGIDTLYVVDGATNTIVGISNASQLVDKDEITVESGGTTFKCKHPSDTCATLVYSGSPLDGPVASALLPNGNLIVANTEGTANTLVELTPQGQVLDTKVVDKSATQGVFGLAASGTSDSNTVLFYSDTNSNTVHELKQ